MGFSVIRLKSNLYGVHSWKILKTKNPATQKLWDFLFLIGKYEE